MVFLLFFTALVLSGIAAYYSIIGLIAIFAASAIPVAVMGGSLEVAKLVVASWLYRYWKQIPLLMKSYFTIALVVLMIITSMGIFGFLSKAHIDQGVPTGDVQAQINLIEDRINLEKENIKVSRETLAQMDAQVNEALNRTKNAEDTAGVNRSVNIRRQQARERAKLQKEIETANANIRKLNEEKVPLASQLRKVEAEVGPIKYIAAMIYGDNPDQNTLERAVRWLIILLICVFDPLAVLMLIAANLTQIKQKEWKVKKIDEEPKYEQDDGPITTEQIDQIKDSSTNNNQYRIIPDETVLPVSNESNDVQVEVKSDVNFLDPEIRPDVKVELKPKKKTPAKKTSKKKVEPEEIVKDPVEQNIDDKSIVETKVIGKPITVDTQVQEMIDTDDQQGLEQVYKKIVKELAKKNRAKSTHWGPIKNTKNG